ncbi:putative aldolase class 2 protein CC_1201 [Bolinopsis microptera]|uniref:putative aldolase class 2 protein CC_1201 n=1 Tax=Bolinopsis microptera TaxID=2820187 RepID=UPI00307A7783
MAKFLSKIRNIIKINDITPALLEKWGPEECDTRRILATAYRLTHYFGWDDLIYGHITVRVPGADDHMLINPYGLHYTEVTASNLIKINYSGHVIDQGSTKFPFQPVGYVIHSAIHSQRPDLGCVMHIHSKEGIALTAAVEKIEPVTQASVELGQISYHDFRGIIFRPEDKEPLSRDFPAPSKTLILRNHGLLTGGKTVEEAFNIMYFLHQVCQCYVDSGFTHSPVPPSRLISQEIVDLSRDGTDSCRFDTGYGDQEFEALARLLDYQGFETGYPHSQASRTLLDQNMK